MMAGCFKAVISCIMALNFSKSTLTSALSKQNSVLFLCPDTLEMSESLRTVANDYTWSSDTSVHTQIVLLANFSWRIEKSKENH